MSLPHRHQTGPVVLSRSAGRAGSVKRAMRVPTRALVNRFAIIDRDTVIYYLCDPRTGEPRYVGKTVAPKQRARGHYTSPLGSTSKYPVARWISQLRASGRRPQFLEIETVPAGENWEVREQFHIAEARRLYGRRILNVTDGGGGAVGIVGYRPPKVPRFEFTCQNSACGKTFLRTQAEIKKGRSKFCSKKCQGSVQKAVYAEARPKFVCRNPTCETEFERSPYVLNGSRGKYCSRACANAHRAGSTTGPRVKHTRTVFTCAVCGGRFERTPSEIARGRVKYCGTACNAADKLAANTKGRPVFICRNPGCGNTFERHPYRVAQGYAIFCSRQCHTDWKRKNPSRIAPQPKQIKRSAITPTHISISKPAVRARRSSTIL